MLDFRAFMQLIRWRRELLLPYSVAFRNQVLTIPQKKGKIEKYSFGGRKVQRERNSLGLSELLHESRRGEGIGEKDS